MTNDGTEYELFVTKLQQAILDSEQHSGQKNILIETRKKIADRFGIVREFDLYWEYELGGLTYETVIECKDYSSRVSIEKIDAFITKVNDYPGLRAVFATKTGYQKSAKIKAEKYNIELLLVREQNDSDWSDEDGTPLLKEVHVGMLFHLPARITKFEPFIDGHWALKNTELNPDNPGNFRGLNNQIFIQNNDRSEKYSLHELENTLRKSVENKPGKYSREEKFEDAYLYFENQPYKIVGYKVEFEIGNPLESKIEIDFSKELIGVIEYLDKGIKKSVFEQGSIKESKLR